MASYIQLEWILENKILHDEINCLDKNGWTYLHCLMEYIYRASGKNNKIDLQNEQKIAKLFVAYGIDQNIKNKDGNTAKQLLCKMQDEFYH